MHDRFFAPVKLQQQNSQVAMRIWKVSIDPQSLAKLLNRFVRLPYLRQTDAQVIMVMSVRFAPPSHRSPVRSYRTEPITLPGKNVAETKVNFRTIDANFKSLAKMGQSVI